MATKERLSWVSIIIYNYTYKGGPCTTCRRFLTQDTLFSMHETCVDQGWGQYLYLRTLKYNFAVLVLILKTYNYQYYGCTST